MSRKKCQIYPPVCLMEKSFYVNITQFYFKLYMIFIFILCLWVFCLHIYLCNTFISGSHRSHKMALDSLVLQLQMVIWCFMGARNQLRSWGRKGHSFNYWNLSPALTIPYYLRIWECLDFGTYQVLESIYCGYQEILLLLSVTEY